MLPYKTFPCRACGEGIEMAETSVHMLGYIYENPDALSRTLETCRKPAAEIVRVCSAAKIHRVLLAGLGSSYTAAMMAKPLYQLLLPVPVYIFHSDDIVQVAPELLDKQTLLVVISRSGERGAAMDAAAAGREHGAIVAGVTGAADSLLAEDVEHRLITAEGPEITFPKTKSVLACAGAVLQLGISLAEGFGTRTGAYASELGSIPEKLAAVLPGFDAAVEQVITNISECKALSVAGSLANYGVALEAAVKVQEASNRFTRGDTLAGLLHGPLGAVNEDWAVLQLVTEPDLPLHSAIIRTASRSGVRTVSVLPEGAGVETGPEFIIPLVQRTDRLLAALLYLPVVQFFAYHWTIALGLNPDSPAAMNDILEAILPPGRSEPELRKP